MDKYDLIILSRCFLSLFIIIPRLALGILCWVCIIAALAYELTLGDLREDTLDEKLLCSFGALFFPFVFAFYGAYEYIKKGNLETSNWFT